MGCLTHRTKAPTRQTWLSGWRESVQDQHIEIGTKETICSQIIKHRAPNVSLCRYLCLVQIEAEWSIRKAQRNLTRERRILESS